MYGTVNISNPGIQSFKANLHNPCYKTNILQMYTKYLVYLTFTY